MTSSNNDLLEPVGTTPLPTRVSNNPVKIEWDVKAALNLAQQPQTQQMAVFESPRKDDCINGALVDVCPHFCVYAVKNGLIRVLHLQSTQRSLLRGHAGQRVTDLRFFQSGNVLATAGHVDDKANNTSVKSSILIWRLFDHPVTKEIQSEILLEISSQHCVMTRVIWHPFNPNQLWILHTINSSNGSDQSTVVATLAETTRLQSSNVNNRPVCVWHSDHVIMNGATQIDYSENGTSNNDVLDLVYYSQDPRYVLSAHSSGHVILWNIKQVGKTNKNGTVLPHMVAQIKEDHPVSRCLFLPHVASTFNDKVSTTLTTCFLTASNQNSVITLYSPFVSSSDGNDVNTANLPFPVQILSLANPSSSYLVDIVFAPISSVDDDDDNELQSPPPSCLVIQADRTKGQLYAYHLKSSWSSDNNSNDDNDNDDADQQPLLHGCDYVIPFTTKYPIYSWSVVCVQSESDKDDEDDNVGHDDDDGNNTKPSGVLFDTQLFAYQSSNVQRLTLTSYMCLPPTKTWIDPTPGVTVVERLPHAQQKSTIPSAHVSEIASDVDVYDESYDVEDDDDNEDAEEEEEYEVPEASSLPTPQGVSSRGNPNNGTSGSTSSNPFANWLGALASSSSSSAKATPASLPNPVDPSPKKQDLPFVPTFPKASTQQPTPIGPPPGVAKPANQDPSPPQFLSPADFMKFNDTSKVKKDDDVTAVTADRNKDKKIADNNDNKNKNIDCSNHSSVSKKKAQKSRDSTPIAANRKGNANESSPKKPVTGPVKVLKRQDANSQLSDKISSNKTNEKSQNDSKTSNNDTGVTTQPDKASSISKSGAVNDKNLVESKALSQDLRHAVSEEINTNLIPALQKSIRESLNKSMINPLQSSINELKDNFKTTKSQQIDQDQLARTLCESVQEPLQVAITSSMRKVIIPALESLTNQVLSQVSDHLESQTSLLVTKNDTNDSNNNNNRRDHDEQIAVLSTQLSDMTQLLSQLTTEVRDLKATVAAQAAFGASVSGNFLSNATQSLAPTVPPIINPEEQLRNRILLALQQHQYEKAFTEVIGTQRLDLVVFCCANADLNEVLNGDRPALSQPILLCLLQQLGTVLVQPQQGPAAAPAPDTFLIVEWLQEIALSLNASDATLQPHIPIVLKQLVENIVLKSRNCEPVLRRPLQKLLQIVKGMQIK